MAITTVPKYFRLVDTAKYTFFGYPVPPNVRVCDVMLNNLTCDEKIVWKVHDSLEVHEIDFPHPTEEMILAVLTAMRLSC